MTDWMTLTARGGRAAHDLVGWLMWDPYAIEQYAALGVPDGRGWIQAWRLAPLGDIPVAAATAVTYSIHPMVMDFILGSWRGVTDAAAIAAIRDEAVSVGLDEIAPGISATIAPLAEDLWRGVDAVHDGARTLFAANRGEPRPDDRPALSAWRAVNCLRELRGDNHWILSAAADLDGAEAGLLHSAMVDEDEYGSAEWIARSRGLGDEAIERGWERLEAKGLAVAKRITDAGHAFRHDLERRTDELTAPAWEAIGEASATALCDAVDAHHDAFLARIDATAGPRWMPALRHKDQH